jgi:tetratricopeptide (TPR) repeat protein
MKKTKEKIEQARIEFNEGRFDEAMKLIDPIIDAQSIGIEGALIIRAAILTRTGKLSEAELQISAIENQFRNTSPEVINLKAIILRANRKLNEALELLKKGNSKYPSSIDLAHNLSLTATDLGELELAAKAGEQALGINPKFLEALKNLGKVYVTKRDSFNARRIFQQIDEILPNGVESNVGMGAVELLEGNPEKAIPYLKAAIEKDPTVGPAWANLGISYKFTGKYLEAKESLQKACEVDPLQIENRWNLSLVQLSMGEFSDGWKNYESRYESTRIAPDRVHPPKTNLPMLKKEDLVKNKTIVLLHEQGFGDTFQFFRFAQQLKEEGAGKIIAIVTKEIIDIVRTIPWIDEVRLEIKIQNEALDYWVFPMSLPHRYEISTVDDIPKPLPYMRVGDQEFEFWKYKLDKLGKKKFRVGLVWAGRETHSNDVNRSIKLAVMSRLKVYQDQVDFISLQKGPREQDKVSGDWELHRYGNLINSFTDTSGILANLDLLISIDSAPAHLAGSMGMPVWTLIPEIFDFRWMVSLETSPWYPSMRLFRQKKKESWDSVITRVGLELEKLLLRTEKRWEAPIYHQSNKLNATTLAGINYYLHCALEFHEAGKYDHALDLYQLVKKISPKNIDAIRNIAAIYRVTDKYDLALLEYEYGEKLGFLDSIFYTNYANLLVQLGRYEEALSKASKALESNPQSLRSWSIVSECNQYLGNYQQALIAINKAVEIDNHQDFKFRQIFLLLQIGKQFEAKDRLLEIMESGLDTLKLNLLAANVFQGTGEYELANSFYKKAIDHDPLNPETYLNRGVLKATILDYEGAIDDTRKCIELDPENTEAHFHLAIYLLTLGKFDEGWREYEWRMHPNRKIFQKIVMPNYTIPLWKGESLELKTILLMPEQGNGDQIHFIRYAKWLKSLGAKVLVGSHPQLVTILETCPWVDCVLGEGEPIEADYWIFTMSLPFIAKTSIENIPCEVPYLFGSKNKLTEWSERIGRRRRNPSKPLVGICWEGAASHIRNQYRSIQIEQFSTLIKNLNFEFIGIVREPGAKSSYILDGVLIENLGVELQDFSDTAALIHHLDLLISIDSAPAHMAGAMNKRCWILLDSMPDFRWLLEGDSSPWYPSVRLFRKKLNKGWEDVINKLHYEIDSLGNYLK